MPFSNTGMLNFRMDRFGLNIHQHCLFTSFTLIVAYRTRTTHFRETPFAHSKQATALAGQNFLACLLLLQNMHFSAIAALQFSEIELHGSFDALASTLELIFAIFKAGEFCCVKLKL